MTGADGLLVIDKPAGMTSHDVVGLVRRLAGTRKVGHAGTLDPMATGVLLIGINRATRLLTYLVGADKTYTATVRLGQGTLTDDAEGEVTQVADPEAIAGLTPDAIRAAARALTGRIEQVPSAVSAIKVDGVRSYARVRAGAEVNLLARPVRVDRFEVGDPVPVDTPHGPAIDVPIEVHVSSGTYVRALARDLGAALGVAGHLRALRRTAVGEFGLDRAHRLADLIDAAASPRPELPDAELPDAESPDAELPDAESPDAESPDAESPDAELPDAELSTRMAAHPGSLHPRLPLLGLAPTAAAVLPVRRLDPAEAVDLGFGRAVAADPQGRSGPVAGLAPDGSLVAVLVDRGAQARPAVVFAPATPPTREHR